MRISQGTELPYDSWLRPNLWHYYTNASGQGESVPGFHRFNGANNVGGASAAEFTFLSEQVPPPETLSTLLQKLNNSKHSSASHQTFLIPL